MKKETLLNIIIGTIGGLTFSIGMCMCLVKEWDMLISGVIGSLIGFIVLLMIIPIYKKNHKKVKKEKSVDYGLVLTWIIGIIGSLVMGFGMSKIMVGNASKEDALLGLITGVFGLVVCVLNYPVYSYIKGSK